MQGISDLPWSSPHVTCDALCLCPSLALCGCDGCPIAEISRGRPCFLIVRQHTLLSWLTLFDEEEALSSTDAKPLPLLPCLLLQATQGCLTLSFPVMAFLLKFYFSIAVDFQYHFILVSGVRHSATTTI